MKTSNKNDRLSVVTNLAWSIIRQEYDESLRRYLVGMGTGVSDYANFDSIASLLADNIDGVRHKTSKVIFDKLMAEHSHSEVVVADGRFIINRATFTVILDVVDSSTKDSRMEMEERDVKLIVHLFAICDCLGMTRNLVPTKGVAAKHRLPVTVRLVGGAPDRLADFFSVMALVALRVTKFPPAVDVLDLSASSGSPSVRSSISTVMAYAAATAKIDWGNLKIQNEFYTKLGVLLALAPNITTLVLHNRHDAHDLTLRRRLFVMGARFGTVGESGVEPLSIEVTGCPFLCDLRELFSCRRHEECEVD